MNGLEGVLEEFTAALDEVDAGRAGDVVGLRAQVAAERDQLRAQVEASERWGDGFTVAGRRLVAFLEGLEAAVAGLEAGDGGGGSCGVPAVVGPVDGGE